MIKNPVEYFCVFNGNYYEKFSHFSISFDSQLLQLVWEKFS